MNSRFRRFSAFELVFHPNWMAALFGWCSATAVGAQMDNAFAADFSAYEKKYPWTVSRALIDKRTPGAVPETNFDEALVPKYVLPDIFASADGAKVRTTAEWEQHRRGELLELFRREVFGVAPPKPENLVFRIVRHDRAAMGGQAELRRVAITFALSGEPFTFHLTLFVPNIRQGRAPVFLLLDHRDSTWTDPTRNTKSEFWPAEYVISRGYAIAAIDLSREVDPDKPGASHGVRAFYKKHYARPNELTWGTLSAWAWGASRAVDYFVTDPDIDAARIAVVGHSRGGKTSLWAGAQDVRIGLVIPNNAGDGGPSIARRRFGNTIEVMTGRNPHWFVPRYTSHARHERAMPFDQHMLIALVAPRGYHGGDGSEDLWHDPRGAWLSLIEASRVWTLYGNAKPMDDRMPLVNELLINGPIAYHIREGGHGLLLFDWKLCLDHADSHFGRE